MVTESATQSRAAVSTTVSSTGCTLEVERLMTLSTSLVAVWYSSDSSRSRVRACNSPSSRAFSIAITAWSAKVRTNSICRSVNGSTRLRLMLIVPSAAPSPSKAIATGDNCSLAHVGPTLGLRCTVRARHKAVDFALADCDRCVIGAAKPGGRFGHCVQHRLHIGGRAADDLEYVAGRGLVFERFFEIARAGLQFGEEPRVFDRDDRLVGKGAHQFDLPFGERLDPLPPETNH